MLDPTRVKYDAKKKRLTYQSGVKGKSLLAKALGLVLSKIARSGEYEGQPVKSVAVVFADEKAATHNATPMKYLGLESRHSGGKVTSDAEFTTRADFGMGKSEK